MPASTCALSQAVPGGRQSTTRGANTGQDWRSEHYKAEPSLLADCRVEGHGQYDSYRERSHWLIGWPACNLWEASITLTLEREVVALCKVPLGNRSVGHAQTSGHLLSMQATCVHHVTGRHCAGFAAFEVPHLHPLLCPCTSGGPVMHTAFVPLWGGGVLMLVLNLDWPTHTLEPTMPLLTVKQRFIISRGACAIEGSSTPDIILYSPFRSPPTT